MSTPIFLPAPRNLRLLDGRIEVPEAGLPPGAVEEELAPTTFAGPEAYRLEVRWPDDTGVAPVRITAGEEAGLRHGRRTLAQLVAHGDGSIPCLEIEDAPAFPVRGVMLDVSRDRVPTMESLGEAIRLLGSLKVNHLQLYTEHTFAYRGHEEVWEGWSPITPDEVRELDSLCQAEGIELAANQNCFGHLHRWLSHPRYAPLAEVRGDWIFHDAPRSGGFSLCPGDPGSIELVRDLLGQLLPCFSSPRVNVGCDETFDVGQGRSRSEVGRRGGAAVYLEFLGKIDAVVRELGGEPMFWADMIMRHPEHAGEIPDGMLGLVWGYEPDAPFREQCERLIAAGHECWVCPGTSSWRSIVGRTRDRSANLLAAASQGLAAGATGYLVTDWGDLGHRQQWPISLLGLAEGAARAWNPGASVDPRAAGVFALSDASGDAGPWLAELGDVDDELRRHIRNAGALFTDLEEPLDSGRIIGDQHDWARNALGRIDDLTGRLPTGVPDLVSRELRHTLAVADLAARRALTRFQEGGATTEEREQLVAAARRVLTEHVELWLERSRPGGLVDSSSYYQRVIDELTD